MRFIQTPLAGVVEIEVEPHVDERGSFARIYGAEEFAAHGLEPPNQEAAISRNTRRATLRGLHYFEAGVGPVKLVRCIRGRIFDVAVDLRPESTTFGVFHVAEIDAERGNALFIPQGVAHGFITLRDDCEVLYHFSEAHRPGLERGLRWDDPEVAIPWPLTPEILSERDRGLPLLGALSL